MSDRRKNTPQEIAEVALAFAAGKTIETRAIDGPLIDWYDVGNPAFNFYYYQYRVKPEPERMFIIYKNGTRHRVLHTQRDADYALKAYIERDGVYQRKNVWLLKTFEEVQKSP
jgi:hypothetical protein